MLKVYCFNHDHLLDVIINHIHNIEGVQDTETLVSLDSTIDRQVWVKDKKEDRGYRHAHNKENLEKIEKPKKRGRRAKKPVTTDQVTSIQDQQQNL